MPRLSPAKKCIHSALVIREILADMGVSVSTVRSLREAGHDSVHLRDQGLLKSTTQLVSQSVGISFFASSPRKSGRPSPSALPLERQRRHYDHASLSKAERGFVVVHAKLGTHREPLGDERARTARTICVYLE